MSDAASTLKRARLDAGLTQAQLARRLGVSQAAVAKLERPSANPTVFTLEDVLRAMDRRLDLVVTRRSRGIDETLIAQQMRLTPAERLVQLKRMYEWSRQLAHAGVRARGEPN